MAKPYFSQVPNLAYVDRTPGEKTISAYKTVKKYTFFLKMVEPTLHISCAFRFWIGHHRALQNLIAPEQKQTNNFIFAAHAWFYAGVLSKLLLLISICMKRF